MAILQLSPLTVLLRDIVVTTVTLVNSRFRWIICGSGRSGVSTLQAAFQTSSDVLPDLPSTEAKVGSRVLKAQMEGSLYRFRTADMMNQPQGRWQYLEEIINQPVGIVYVFKTYRQNEKGAIMDEHLKDKSNFKETAEGHLRHEKDYEQFRFLTNAFLYPDTLEKNYPDVFKESALQSDIRQRYQNNYSSYAPPVLIMAGNFLDITFPMEKITSPVQYEYQLREFLRSYMEIYQPLTDQWQRFQRKGRWGGRKPPCSVRYTGISAKYNIGVQNLLTLMRNSVGIMGG